MIPYLFDTNVFIQAWEISYRPQTFGVVWDWIERAAHEGTIASLVYVRRELTKIPNLKAG